MIVVDDRKLYYAASASLHQLLTDCLLSPASTKTLIQGKDLHGHGQGVKGLLKVTCVSSQVLASVTAWYASSQICIVSSWGVENGIPVQCCC